MRKDKFLLSLLVAALMGLGVASAQAPQSQNATAAPSSDAASSGANSVRTLSGCLQQGAGANEYTLFGQDATSWELRSVRVDLSAHVGQAVTVAYVTSANNSKTSAGAGTPIVVTDLVMVSSSCSP